MTDASCLKQSVSAEPPSLAGCHRGTFRRIEKGSVPLHFLLAIEKDCIKQRILKPVAGNPLSASTARAGPVEGHQQAWLSE